MNIPFGTACATIIFLFTACGESADHNKLVIEYQEPLMKSFLQLETQDEMDNWISQLSEQEAATYADAIRTADVIRTTTSNDRGYFEDEVLEKVTRKYGPSIIDLKKVPYQTAVTDTGVRPWSSWWYPKKEKRLFYNPSGDAPLQKYDKYRDRWYRKHRGQRAPGSATTIEESQYNPNSIIWEGLCNAWAFASILAPEPTIPKSIRFGVSRVVFDVADQKALLMKIYEGIKDDEIEVFGQKFTGDQDGWIHPDPFPDQFHRFIEKKIIEDKEAFVMDHNAGVEIWNVPVFKANYSISKIAGRNDAVLVRTWLFTAAPNSENEVGNVGTKEMIREYHYILYGDIISGNRLKVKSGVWIKGSNGTDSRKGHPDYFIRIPKPKSVSRESFNPAIESEVVDAILNGEDV